MREKGLWRQLVWAAVLLLLLLSFWLLLRLIPAAESAPPAPEPALGSRFENTLHNRLGETMVGLGYIPKHFTIPPGSLPPSPQEEGFGVCGSPEEVLAVLDRASALLGEESVTAWTPETELRPGTELRYYLDETMLVLVWQELWEKRVCTWCEVKLTDPSQLRRKLSGDLYGSGVQVNASELARQDRAVLAISGDFYSNRSCGVHVWQGQLFRVGYDPADTCFFTRGGDMLFSRMYELNTWEQARRFVQENDVEFSVAFGPVLVENGEKALPSYYPWGEIDDAYARAALSQVGELHYVFVAANCDVNEYLRLTAGQTAELMLSHGCQMAYALDGGQTASVILNGELINRPEFGFERPVSDIIAFATAYPGEGGA